jgi:hypothetical protein
MKQICFISKSFNKKCFQTKPFRKKLFITEPYRIKLSSRKINISATKSSLAKVA